jgi:hypothetical protein
MDLQQSPGSIQSWVTANIGGGLYPAELGT